MSWLFDVLHLPRHVQALLGTPRCRLYVTCAPRCVFSRQLHLCLLVTRSNRQHSCHRPQNVTLIVRTLAHSLAPHNFGKSSCKSNYLCDPVSLMGALSFPHVPFSFTPTWNLRYLGGYSKLDHRGHLFGLQGLWQAHWPSLWYCEDTKRFWEALTRFIHQWLVLLNSHRASSGQAGEAIRIRLFRG